MNNRFEQLWQQVNLQECDCGCNPDEFLRLRFAELIVKECVKIADNHYDTKSAIHDIKEHFGIEE